LRNPFDSIQDSIRQSTAEKLKVMVVSSSSLFLLHKTDAKNTGNRHIDRRSDTESIYLFGQRFFEKHLSVTVDVALIRVAYDHMHPGHFGVIEWELVCEVAKI
jgi:hypothetical protein